MNEGALLGVYNYIKKDIAREEDLSQIEFYEHIPEDFDKLYFFREYCWVVIHSGMNYAAATKIFDNFWGKGRFNFVGIKHKGKNAGIRKVYEKLDKYFFQYKKSKNKLKFLENLPWIGPITKYHLAKNLGENIAKPDRHLVRVSEAFGYSNAEDPYKAVLKFCEKVSELSKDKISIIDTYFWRFATLHRENYLELFQNLMESCTGCYHYYKKSHLEKYCAQCNCSLHYVSRAKIEGVKAATKRIKKQENIPCGWIEIPPGKEVIDYAEFSALDYLEEKKENEGEKIEKRD